MGEYWRWEAERLCRDFAAGRPLPGRGAPTSLLIINLLTLTTARLEVFEIVKGFLRGSPLYPELCAKLLRYAIGISSLDRPDGDTALARWAIAQVGPGLASEMLTDRFVECFREGDPAYIEWLFTLGPGIAIHTQEDYCIREAAVNDDLKTVLRFLALPGGRAVGRYHDDAATLEHIGEECGLEVLRAMWGLYPEEYLAGEAFRAARCMRRVREMAAACFEGDRARAASFHSCPDVDGPSSRRTYDSSWVIENTKTRGAAECVAEFMGSGLASDAREHIEALRWADRAGWVAAVVRAAQR